MSLSLVRWMERIVIDLEAGSKRDSLSKTRMHEIAEVVWLTARFCKDPKQLRQLHGTSFTTWALVAQIQVRAPTLKMALSQSVLRHSVFSQQ